MKHMRPLRIPLFAAALVALAGCANLQDLLNQSFQKPTLTFERADLKDVSLGGATLELVYRLNNPNAVGISLASVDYALAIEGHPLVSGKPPNGFQIPANGSTEVTFPATVRFAELGQALSVFLSKDVAHYQAQGHLGVQTPIGVVTLPLSKSGSFQVPKVPQIAFGSPVVENVSFSGATVSLPLTVTNRGPLPIPIGGLLGAFEIAGHKVADLSTDGLGTVPAHGSQQLTLPLNLRFGDAGFALLGILRGGSANVRFEGKVASGDASVPLSAAQLVKFLAR